MTGLAVEMERPLFAAQCSLLRKMSLMADCVSKVESCRAAIFSRKHETEVIADSHNLNRVTGVACEFNVRR